MAGLAAVAKNTMLDALAAITQMGLHSADPGGSGTSNELTGGSPAYARKTVTWSGASGSSKSLSAAPVFDIPAGSTVAYVSYWASGVFWGSRALSASETYTGQGTYTLTTDTESLT